MAHAFILLVSAAWFFCMLLSSYPGVATNDSMRQLQEGISGVYTNWKPAIYSWQLGALERLCPEYGLGLAYTIQMLGFAVAVAAMALYYTRHHPAYALLVLVLPAFFTQKCMLVTTVGNDEMAAVCYLLFIACVLFASECPRGWRRGLILLGWVLLGYGLALRHNALPAVLLLACWGGWKLGIRGWGKIIGTSVAGVVFAMLLNTFAVYHCLKAEPSYPLRSPLVDDIVNLSILEGEWHPVVREFNPERLEAPHEQCIFAPESGNWNAPINPYTLYPEVEKRRRDYELLKSAWWDMVSAHPQRYLVTKLFFFHQFLLEGRCVPWLCEQLRKDYPHIRIHMEQESRDWRAWVNRGFLSMGAVPLVCYAFLLLCLLRPLRCWVAECPVRVDAVVFTGVAFLYTSSFVRKHLMKCKF